MFDEDKPIEHIYDDKLGRKDFSKYLANSIFDYNSQNSLVVGLSGEWGSGKTSIINMAIEYIRNSENGHKLLIIKFNPWNYSEQNQLILQFFNELSVNLEKQGINPTLTKKIKSYAEKLTTPAVIVGSVIRPQTTKTLMDYFHRSKPENETLEKLRKDIDTSIRQLKNKIVIVIDDIDRLNTLEIRQVFQLVKLLANFPNTIYLISFDKESVIKTLKGTNESYDSKYLEKIVQIILEVPLISEIEIEDILLQEIFEIVSDIPVSKLDVKRFIDVYRGESGHDIGLKRFFKNIRNVKRYINTAKFGFEIVKHEVDVFDFFIITALQLFEPELYNKIRNNKDLFVYSSNPIYQVNTNGNRLTDLINKILEKEELENLFILKNLFPKLNSNSSDESYVPEWKNQGRICAEENFDTYFRFSVPKWELSTEEAKLIINSHSQEIFETALLKLKYNKEIKFLEFLEGYLKHDDMIPNKKIECIFHALMNIGDSLVGSKGNVDLKIYFLLTEIGFKFENEEDRFDIFKNSIKESNSLYIPVYCVSALEEQYLKPANSLKKEDLFLNPQNIGYLKDIVCEKITSWNERGKLANVKQLQYILKYWGEWGHTEDVRKFIKNDTNLIAYLTSYLTGTGKNPIDFMIDQNIRWPSYLKDINKFIEKNELKIRLEKLDSSKLQNLMPSERLALDSLLENLKNI